MHILLVTPENRFIRAFRAGQLNNFAQLTMPYLAAFVPARHTVELVDEYNQTVRTDRRFDLVGITVNTPNAPHVYAMASRFRARGAQVVLGGPHVTLLPDEAQEHADAIVVGEAEETWPAVIADAERGRLERRYVAPRPPRLEGLPRARRELVHGRALLGNTVVATRGCPHRCSFCNLRQIYSPEIRFRPVGEVAAEIATFRSPWFTFWDDQLFMSSRYARDLFRAIAPLGKKWAAMVTLASTKNEDLLRDAARSGCTCLFLGLESFSAESLRMADKAFNVIDAYRDGVARIHRHGITVQAGIIFGFDGDDATTFDATLRGATDVALDGATISILTPFPRTPIFEGLARDGRLLTRDWSYYNGKTAVAFQPARMTADELWAGYMHFRRRFFSVENVLERVRRSRTRPLQSLVLAAGYRRALEARIPGAPIPPRACDNAATAREDARAPKPRRSLVVVP